MKADGIYNPSPQQPVPLKVFISDRLLNAPTGQCFGKWLPNRNIAIVTAIGDPRDRSNQEIIPFMYWENLSQQVSMKEVATDRTSQHIRVIFMQRTFNGLPLCHSRESVNDSSCPGGLKEDVILIVFDEENVKGHKLTGRGGGYNNYSAWTDSDIEILSDLLRQAERKEQPGKVLKVVHQTLTLLLFVLLWPIVTTLRVFLYGCTAVDQILSPVWVRRLLSLPMVTYHLAAKIHILRGLMGRGEKREKHSDVDRLRFGNKLLVLLVDLVLGCLVCYLSHRYNFHQIVSHHLVEWLQSTSFQLQELLRWLMGAPAGLKLNSGYANFLGHFFLYQSYLWIGYLHILYPIMDNIIWVMTISGSLGLTVLLSVASDILSLLTFHIYCFYVYAAKIFTLQLSALISLSRLFRGRKWNVLRNRVDSCRYDIDQLVVGTLIFTVLLFLLPTSLLFYSVFTGLQIVVLVIRGTITTIIYHISTFPWYTAIKWLLRNPIFRDQIVFVYLKRDPDGVSYLVLKMMSLMRAISLSREVYRDDQDQPSWIELIKNILQGRVIYKWKKLTRS